MHYVYSNIASNWLQKVQEISQLKLTNKGGQNIFEEEPILTELIAELFLSLNLMLPGYEWYRYKNIS